MEFDTKVLDHGFIKLRNISGPTRRIWAGFDADDVDPAQSARMSFNQMGVARARDADLKLCEYLIAHWHTTPFEMIEVWVEMKLPIFVARQFVRHRTASINEISGRYVTLPAEWYLPEIVGGKAADKKQGQEDVLTREVQEWFREALDRQCGTSYTRYQEALSRGVAPEHARMFLHLNHYTHWLWKQDLHNMTHFLSLRTHEHAQIEAQAYAKAVHDILERVLPETMRLFGKYRKLK